MSWGGKRAGAGRPRKEISSAKPTHSIRASREEWAIIKPFIDIVKLSRSGYCEAEKHLNNLALDLDNKYYNFIRKDNEETIREMVQRVKFDIMYGGK